LQRTASVRTLARAVGFRWQRGSVPDELATPRSLNRNDRHMKEALWWGGIHVSTGGESHPSAGLPVAITAFLGARARTRSVCPGLLRRDLAVLCVQPSLFEVP
jgi:hypothetical protein